MVKNKMLIIEIETAGWRKIRHLAARLEQAARVTLAHLPAKFRFPCTATLLLTGDKAMHQLNHDFRGLDKPTNVLSFPQFAPSGLTKMGRTKGSKTPPLFLGDIAMGYQYMVGEAKKDNKILINHAVHLMIHGLLHLFGYDHLSGTEAARMERLEIKVMAALGLPDPYRTAQHTETKRVRKAGHKRRAAKHSIR